MNDTNTQPHPFLIALKEQSYKTAWYMIQYNMDLNDVYQARDILDNKSIMAYLIDGMAAFETGYLNDEGQEQKLHLESVLNHYQSLNWDHEDSIESAKNAIIQNYQNIVANNINKTESGLYSNKKYLSKMSVTKIFSHYSGDTLNAICINDNGNNNPDQSMDLASWMAFNVSDINLLKETLVQMEQCGFDFNKTQYDIRSIILKNDLENQDFYNSNPLLPKSRNLLNSKMRNNFNFHLLSNNKNLTTIIDLLAQYNNDNNINCLSPKDYTSHFNTFLMDKEPFVPQDVPKNSKDSQQFMDFIQANSAHDIDQSLNQLDQHDIDQVDQTNQSLLFYLSRMGNLMKMERLSRKNPDWFKGNEYGFPFYNLCAYDKQRLNTRETNYWEKMTQRIVQTHDIADFCDQTIKGLQTIQTFHADHLFKIDIDLTKEIKNIDNFKTNCQKLIGYWSYIKNIDNQNLDTDHYSLICEQAINDLENTLYLKQWCQNVDHINGILPHLSYDKEVNDYTVSSFIANAHDYVSYASAVPMSQETIRDSLNSIARDIKELHPILPESIRESGGGLAAYVAHQSFAKVKSSYSVYQSLASRKKNKKERIDIPENIDGQSIIDHNEKILTTLKNNFQALAPDCKDSVQNILLNEHNKHKIQDKRNKANNKPKML